MKIHLNRRTTNNIQKKVYFIPIEKHLAEQLKWIKEIASKINEENTQIQTKY